MFKRFISVVVVFVILLSILPGAAMANSFASVQEAGVCKCQKGGSYGLTVDWKGLHHYIEFNVGQYATSRGSRWSLSPNTATAVVQIGRIKVTKVFGTSVWGPVNDKPGYVRFGINGDGIVSLVTSSSNFSVCWDQW
jgi:hypothetical protein